MGLCACWMQIDVLRYIYGTVLGWNRVEAHSILCLELKESDEM
jgi:hypothetical protein